MDERIAELLRRLEEAGSNQELRKEIVGELVSALADELRQRASRLMSRESPGHDLQTTALFHEMYIRLAESHLTFADRRVFLTMSSYIMRQILVDAARSRDRLRNNAGKFTALDFDSAEQAAIMDPEVLIDLDDAMQKLSEEDRQMIDLVFFYGLTLQETAAALGIKYETLRRRWYSARRRLYTSLQDKGLPGKVRTAG